MEQLKKLQKKLLSLDVKKISISELVNIYFATSVVMDTLVKIEARPELVKPWITIVSSVKEELALRAYPPPPRSSELHKLIELFFMLGPETMQMIAKKTLQQLPEQEFMQLFDMALDDTVGNLELLIILREELIRRDKKEV